MIPNEKLIAEAAAAVLRAHRDHPQPGEVGFDNDADAWAEAIARAALAVFEKAHTPNDDEQAPREFQAYELTVDMLEDLLVTAGVASNAHGLAIRKTAGALVYKIGRRLAVEPQAEPSDDLKAAITEQGEAETDD